MDNDTKHMVEALIDRIGMSAFLDGVSAICMGKADHLRIEWQDPLAGRSWAKVARNIDALNLNVVEGLLP